ncbi:HNH endonuclease [Microbacterium laevaniformans OR221]|nr:HNH endonuclease [Microbacterium laevaniformans OR221]
MSEVAGSVGAMKVVDGSSFPDVPGGWDAVEDDAFPCDPGWVPPDAVDLICDADAMVAVFAAERYRRIAAYRREALADAAGRGRGLIDVAERAIRLELAAALRVTEHAAGMLIAEAQALETRYPAALAALGAARVTERHVHVLVELLDPLAATERDAVFPRALVLAEAEPVGTFRRRVRALIDQVRVESLPERHERALDERRVFVEPADDGMAWLNAYLPAVEAHAIHGRLTAIAKAVTAADGDERTLEQARADVFGDLLIDGTCTAHPDAARGIRATVVVTVPALALLDAPTDALNCGVAVVDGVGPIPIDRARELCGGGDGWMRLLTHPDTGAVVSVGRERYRPPPALQQLARWRAARCMAPGCGMPADRCDLDHTLAWEHGGHTALTNLAPLCRGHHTVKHHGGWQVRHLTDPTHNGALEWISPYGRRYVVAPERTLPVFTR